MVRNIITDLVSSGITNFAHHFIHIRVIREAQEN